MITVAAAAVFAKGETAHPQNLRQRAAQRHVTQAKTAAAGTRTPEEAAP
jgi:hypothetical protein